MVSRIALRAILLLSLTCFLASFVLLGHIASTLLPMYALAMIGVAGYAMARGLRNGLASFADYLGSRTMAPRWLFLALAALSLLWTPRGGTLGGSSGLTRVMTLLLIQISGWIIYDAVRRLGEFANILRIVFYSSAIGTIIALLDLSALQGYRIRGLFGNPNVLAITGTLGLLAFIGYLARRMPGWERAAAVVLSMFMQAAVFASGSRKGALGLVLVWLVGLTFGGARRLTMGVIGLTLAVGFFGFALAPRPVQDAAFRSIDRLGTIFVQSTTSATIDYSAAERTRFAAKGLELIAEAPVFGHGLDTFRAISGEGTYAHNNYIDLGVGVGLLGVLLFYAFPLGLIYWLIRMYIGSVPGSRQVAVFGLVALVLILVMDVGAVTYMSKLVSIVPILIAGAIDGNAGDGHPDSAVK